MPALLVALAALVLAAVPAAAQRQKPRWMYQQVTQQGLEKLSPRIAVDAWGNRHLTWTMKDPAKSGLQIFYSHDISGRFAVPYQVTSKGTVYDSVGSATTPYVFKLDAIGRAHVVYVANVLNHLQLYYTNNVQGEFSEDRLRLLTEDRIYDQERVFDYDMAVDSSGTAHVVWLKPDNGQVDVWYWNSRTPDAPAVLTTVPCRLGFGCKLGDPDVEFSTRDTSLHIAYRAYRGDTAFIYHVTRRDVDGTSNVAEIELGLQRTLARAERADLRVRMAIDSVGFIHMAAPFQDGTKYRLLYLSNSTGYFQQSYLDAGYDSTFADFDLTSDGGVRVVAAWNVARKTGGRETGVIEREVDRGRGWEVRTLASVPRMRVEAVPAPKFPEGTVSRVAARNGRIEVVGHMYVPGDSTFYQIGLFTRSSVRPELSYILPDAAAPGMSVVVEAFAPFRANGSFGPDGFRKDTVSFVLANVADNARVVIGPTVVSWDGRLASATIFVKPGAAPGPVSLALRVDTAYSNYTTFYVVEPQHIGEADGHLKLGGVLGSGGILGTRSPRGVMVVDSLILDAGTYTVSTDDPDLETPGNQGYLPVTILSRGPIRIEPGATLSVSASNDEVKQVFGNAGPGGGGGGSGGEARAGAGFTGGGGVGKDESAPITGASVGTGDSVSGRWGGGRSLNGTPGGGVYGKLGDRPGIPGTAAASGGGTGHPFGASGSHGQISIFTPATKSLGGYGAGSGGGRSFNGQPSSGGGGGANGGLGNSGHVYVEGEGNGGLISGSAQIVPLAGGGGGGGGGFSGSGLANGGGGGGAILLVSGDDMVVGGELLANGARGRDGDRVIGASGGGGGGGGSIFLASRGNIDLAMGASISARGGQGGATGASGSPGGDGGYGRIRIDGRPSPDTVARVTYPKLGYSGPATFRTSRVSAEAGAVVSGFGTPGKLIRVFVSPEKGDWSGAEWSYDVSRETQVQADGTWQIPLGNVDQSKRLYVVTMQATGSGPARDNYSYEPAWVMSPAGGAILGKPAVSLAVDSLRFECIRFDTCVEADVYVSNTGEITDLIIANAEIGGADKSAFTVKAAPGVVHAQESRPIRVRFCPNDTGAFAATLKLKTNAAPAGEKTVTIAGCAVSGTLAAREIEVDLGEICINECRDTVIHLRNDGQAPLTVTSVGGDELDIAVTAKTSLPLTIQPGESQPLELKLCLKRFPAMGTTLKIANTSIDPVFAKVVVRGVNAGANVDFAPAIDFGVIDRSKNDSCRTQTIAITNKSTTTPVRIRMGRPASARFTVEAPSATDLLIAPGASEAVTVTFCGDTEIGDFADLIPITLGDGTCAVDSVIRLTARVAMAAPQFVIVAPESGELIFPPTSVNTPSAYQDLTIRNVGTASGVIASIVPTGINGTNDDEIEVDLRGQTLPYRLDRDREITVGVRIAPKASKEIEGKIQVSEQGGSWSTAVPVRGRGVKPGIQTNVNSVNFGDVRLFGQSDSVEIRIFNTGTEQTVVNSIELTPTGQFVKVAGPSGGTLLPGGPPLVMFYAFTPRAEGPQSASLIIHDDAGVTPTIELRGRGVMEHAVVTPAKVDFDCVREGRDSIIIIELRNTGTHPMTVSSGAVTFGNDAFQLIGASFPQVIAPGAAQKYSVRFAPKRDSHNGLIQMVSSAEEPIEILLLGTTCTEITGIGLDIDDVTADIGSNVVIPVRVRLERPTKVAVPYTLTLTYPYDLLVPLDATRSDAQKARIDGSLSSSADFSRSGMLGEVTVTGTMRPSNDLNTQLLVGIPMKVLLGSGFRGELGIRDASFSLAGAKLTAQGGTFVATVCDTAGGIVVLGKYSLEQSYPNPSTPTAVIRYEIAARERVVLNLYDANGLLVRTLIDEVQDAGVHEFVLQTTTIPAGIYTYELLSGRYRKTERMVIVN